MSLISDEPYAPGDESYARRNVRHLPHPGSHWQGLAGGANVADDPGRRHPGRRKGSRQAPTPLPHVCVAQATVPAAWVAAVSTWTPGPIVELIVTFFT